MFKYDSGYRYVNVHSSWKAENVKRVVRGSYHALSSSIVNADCTKDIVLADVVRNLKQEMKHICSSNHDSILLDNHEAIKHFSWETIWMELNKEVPTLMKLLTGITSSSLENKPMLCLIASMILKSRYSRMALAQRAISVFLYGNGVPKQVCF